MHILSVTNTYPPADISGVGALVYELAHLYGDDGHPVRVITRVAPEGDVYAVAAGGAKVLFPIYAAWRFLRLVGSSELFDIVHVHESDGVFVSLALRIGRLLRLRSGHPRLVATLHVSYTRERRSVRPILANGKVVSTPVRSERIFAWVRAPLHAMLGRLTARLADAVVTPSRVTATEIEEDYGVKPETAIPNGVPRWLAETADDKAADDKAADDKAADGKAADGKAAEPDNAGPASSVKNRRPVVICVGRLRTRKAIAVLIEAFVRLLALHPKAHLVLAGNGELREALEEQAEALGVASAVDFLGAVPRAEMDSWYGAADIFCLPSIYEGFPVVILEAMAAGLPVVSTTVSGIPEAIEDGVTGLLVAPEDAVALADALDKLAADPSLCSEMGRNARASLRENFSIETTGAAYMELFEHCLNSS